MSSFEDIDNNLKCPLCFQPYQSETNIPLIIPCRESHTICSQCLSTLLSKPGKFHCPLDGTTPNNKDKNSDKYEFELNKALIQAIEDYCKEHPTRKLDLICKQCRCKICLACEKRGNHQGHETLLVEEYEKKFVTKLEDTHKCLDRICNVQTLKESILKTKEAESIKHLDIVINEYIEKINSKRMNMTAEIKSFFNNLRYDLEIGLPGQDDRTSQFLKWKNETAHKTLKLKDITPFNELSFKFVDENKLLADSELDAWFKLSQDSLQKLERDLEEFAVKLKIELETVLEEMDVLSLKIRIEEKEKGELKYVDIIAREQAVNGLDEFRSPTSFKKRKYKEKELKKALELLRESLSGNQSVEEEIIPGVGISLRIAKDTGIQALYNITRDNTKLKLWTRHVKNLTLGCSNANDQHLLLLRDSLSSLNALTTLTIDFTSNTQMTEKGLVALSQGISQLTSLTELDINFTRVTNITNDAMEKFSLIFPALRDLVELEMNFTQCQAFNDERMTKMVTYLHSLKNLQIINLCFKDAGSIGDTGLSNFGKSLGSLSSLKTLELDFSGNPNITDKGLIELTQALYHLNHVETINMNFASNQAISDKGLDEVGWALSHLTKLSQISLNFTKAHITTYGLEQLGDTLSHLSNLGKIELNFTNTLASEKSLEKLGMSLSSLTNIHQIRLNFSWAKIEEEIINKFGLALSELKNLINIHIELTGCEATTINALKSKLQAYFPSVPVQVEV